MNCHDCRQLLQAYLEGTMDPRGLASVNAHVAGCAECRKEFQSLRQIQEAVGAAFRPSSAADEGRRRILAELAQCPGPALPGAAVQRPLLMRLLPLAACLLLAVGVLIGIGASRLIQPGRTTRGTGAAVPIKISSLEGTVLVKHAGSALWQELAPSCEIFVGDIFLCPAKSAITLALKDASTVTLAPNGTVSLEEYDGRTKFNLGHGTLKAALNTAHPPFFVATPNGLLEALGTEFTVSVK